MIGHGRVVAAVELSHGVADAVGNGVFLVPAEQVVGVAEAG